MHVKKFLVALNTASHRMKDYSAFSYLFMLTAGIVVTCLLRSMSSGQGINDECRLIYTYFSNVKNTYWWFSLFSPFFPGQKLVD